MILNITFSIFSVPPYEVKYFLYGYIAEQEIFIVNKDLYPFYFCLLFG